MGPYGSWKASFSFLRMHWDMNLRLIKLAMCIPSPTLEERVRERRPFPTVVWRFLGMLRFLIVIVILIGSCFHSELPLLLQLLPGGGRERGLAIKRFP